MAQKSQLLEIVEQGQTEIIRFAGTLTEDERKISGTPERWGPRDLLAHMAFWKLHTAERIAAARQGAGEEPVEGYQQTNEAVFEQFRGASWEEIADLLKRSHLALVEQVNLLTDEEINTPGYFKHMGSEAVWHRIVGNGLAHPLSHIGPAYLERGENEYCDQMRGREEALMSSIDSSPEWQAVGQYNLACHWALSGNKQKALELLEFSFRYRPDLIDWSAEDTDLVSLHGTPEFLFLLESAKKIHKTD